MSAQCRLPKRVAAVCVLAAVAILVPAGVAAAQAGASAKALAEAMKFAPPGAIGVGYLDVAAVREKFDAAVPKELRDKAKAVSEILNLAKKVDSVAMWFGPDFERQGPMVVLCGQVSLDDLKALTASLEGKELELSKQPNGRYDVRGTTRFIIGSEAKDVPAGAILMGEKKLLTDSFVASLGKEKNEALVKLLGSVDASAPLGLAMTFPGGPDKDSPVKSILASGFPLGDKPSTVTLAFRDEEFAQKAAGDILKLDTRLPQAKGLLQIARDGASVRVEVKADAALPAKLVQVIIEAQQQAMHAMSMNNLMQISKAVHMYAVENRDFLPLDLGALTEYIGSPQVLVSKLSGRKPPKFQDGKIVGEADYVYVLAELKPAGGQAPKPIAMNGVKEPSKFVLVYERPENYGDKGTAAAFLDGHVEFLTPEKFKAAMEETRKELKRLGW